MECLELATPMGSGTINPMTDNCGSNIVDGGMGLVCHTPTQGGGKLVGSISVPK